MWTVFTSIVYRIRSNLRTLQKNPFSFRTRGKYKIGEILEKNHITILVKFNILIVSNFLCSYLDIK
jgi:hypothetical protein